MSMQCWRQQSGSVGRGLKSPDFSRPEYDPMEIGAAGWQEAAALRWREGRCEPALEAILVSLIPPPPILRSRIRPASSRRVLPIFRAAVPASANVFRDLPEARRGR